MAINGHTATVVASRAAVVALVACTPSARYPGLSRRGLSIPGMASDLTGARGLHTIAWHMSTCSFIAFMRRQTKVVARMEIPLASVAAGHGGHGLNGVVLNLGCVVLNLGCVGLSGARSKRRSPEVFPPAALAALGCGLGGVRACDGLAT